MMWTTYTKWLANYHAPEVSCANKQLQTIHWHWCLVQYPKIHDIDESILEPQVSKEKLKYYIMRQL